MLILTTFNREMMDCGILCVRSVERYLTKHPQFHFAVESTPENFDRHPSWFKVRAILKHLPDHDFVTCLDADTLIVGNANMRDMLEDKTLNLARDKHGPNNGVATWKNCPEAFYTLETMERSFPKWKDHPWHEQHQLMEMESELQIGYQPKHIWNAYDEDANAETLIRHWPGISPKDRLPLMLKTYQALTTEAASVRKGDAR